ncbi:hypothetical protein TWF481_001915 [Arthrobotrys musiformis]|uniref:Uncharacterized protein n=1 Tax=Arthrobotrys musiformis TaxID=47236 RepID=A0AAV9VWN7_9PEZI
MNPALPNLTPIFFGLHGLCRQMMEGVGATSAVVERLWDSYEDAIGGLIKSLNLYVAEIDCIFRIARNVEAVPQETEEWISQVRLEVDKWLFEMSGIRHCDEEIDFYFRMWLVYLEISRYYETGDYKKFKRNLKRMFVLNTDLESDGSGVFFKKGVHSAKDILRAFPWMRAVLQDIRVWKPEGNGQGESFEL